MHKIMTIVGTRPELIKMSRVIKEFDNHTNHILVHTGQNYDYELNQIFFDELEIRKPNYFLAAANNSSSLKSIASIIEKTDEILAKEQPQGLLIYGDTDSCLAVIAAKRHKIPIFHMEAGNRCFDQRVPEEVNRKIVDHLSDINMVLTEHARRYLIREGISIERIIKTGSHMYEVLNYYMPKILKSLILEKLSLEKNRFFLVSSHRAENVDNVAKLQNLLDSLEMLAQEYDIPIIVSTHPRTKKLLSELSTKKLHPKINFLKPFGFFDYVMLQLNSFCVLSDSGTITEEASILNLPAINIRESHERPEGDDEGTLIMSGLKVENILNAVRIITKQYTNNTHPLKIISDYSSDLVSRKVLRIVTSYIDSINRKIWFK